MGILGHQQRRLMHKSLTGANYWQADGETTEAVNDLVNFMDEKRPTFTLLYFSASWNPKCAEIEQDYENLTAK